VVARVEGRSGALGGRDGDEEVGDLGRSRDAYDGGSARTLPTRRRK
jgi:hypothetical protein